MSTPTFSCWSDVPTHLKTKTQLHAAGLKPAKDAAPDARIEYGRGRRYRNFALFDEREAVPRPTATPAQLAALEKARVAQLTCKGCGRVVEHRWQLTGFEWISDGHCYECDRKAETAYHAASRNKAILWARKWLSRDDWLILDTETLDLHDHLIEIAVLRPDGAVAFESRVRPPEQGAPCSGGDLARWGERFPASEIHGITPEMVKDAPGFADLEPQLRALLHGKSVLIYNASYDRDVLRLELETLNAATTDKLRPQKYAHQAEGEERQRLETAWSNFDAARKFADVCVSLWLQAVNWVDVMRPYAKFVGEWNERRQDYKWQKLNGGHRAVGDCRAVLALMQEMADAESEPASLEQPSFS